jgi:hypothetical protein
MKSLSVVFWRDRTSSNGADMTLKRPTNWSVTSCLSVTSIRSNWSLSNEIVVPVIDNPTSHHEVDQWGCRWKHITQVFVFGKYAAVVFDKVKISYWVDVRIAATLQIIIFSLSPPMSFGEGQIWWGTTKYKLYLYLIITNLQQNLAVCIHSRMYLSTATFMNFMLTGLFQQLRGGIQQCSTNSCRWTDVSDVLPVKSCCQCHCAWW